MSKLKLWVGIILVFVLGALVGSFGAGMYIKHKFTSFFFEGPGNGPPPPPPVMHFLMRRIDRQLDLTEKQRIEIEKIMDESMEEFHNIRQKYHPEMKTIVEKNFDRIKEKLNSEQIEKLDRLHEELKDRWQHRRGFRQGPMHAMSEHLFSRLKDSLKLSEVQEEKVRPIIEADIEKRRTIFETYKGQDRRGMLAMRNEMHELHKTTEKQLEKILTEEQMSEYWEMLEEQRRHLHEGMPHHGPHGFGGPSNL